MRKTRRDAGTVGGMGKDTGAVGRFIALWVRPSDRLSSELKAFLMRNENFKSQGSIRPNRLTHDSPNIQNGGRSRMLQTHRNHMLQFLHQTQEGLCRGQSPGEHPGMKKP